MTVDRYRTVIDLEEPVSVEPNPNWEADIADVLASIGVSTEPGESPLQVLHGVLAIADPGAFDADVVSRVEEIAAGWTSSKVSIDPMALPTLADEGTSTHAAASFLAIAVADITTIAADAIVNAANEELLGCRLPNHPCIDNAIHSAAGPRLRDDCARIVAQSNGIEPIGLAKISRGYALPSRFVLHTVGPQLVPGSDPTDEERAQLYGCYQSSLETAAEVEAVRSIAFCGISTGVFAFPKPQAAALALNAIDDWVRESPDRFDRLVIDCFSADDAAIYRAVHAQLYGS